MTFIDLDQLIVKADQNIANDCPILVVYGCNFPPSRTANYPLLLIEAQARYLHPYTIKFMDKQTKHVVTSTITASKRKPGEEEMTTSHGGFFDFLKQKSDQGLEEKEAEKEESAKHGYIIVFFAGGMSQNQMPPLGWMIKAYKTLSRDYRKSIKYLFVVHGSWWFRLIMFFMRTVISSKFAKKVRNCRTVGELQEKLPEIEGEFLSKLPRAILDYDHEIVNKTAPKEEHKNKNQQFIRVQPDTTSMSTISQELIFKIIDYLVNKISTNHSKESYLLFRIPPDQIEYEKFKRWIIKRPTETTALSKKDLEQWPVACLAALLKEFVRDLPEPLLDQECIAIAIDEGNSSEHLDRMLSGSSNELLLAKLLDLLHRLSVTSETSKMTAYALAIVWTPNLTRDGKNEKVEGERGKTVAPLLNQGDQMRQEVEGLKTRTKVVEWLIQNYSYEPSSAE